MIICYSVAFACIKSGFTASLRPGASVFYNICYYESTHHNEGCAQAAHVVFLTYCTCVPESVDKCAKTLLEQTGTSFLCQAAFIFSSLNVLAFKESLRRGGFLCLPCAYFFQTALNTIRSVARLIHTESLSKLRWQSLRARSSARVSIERLRFTGPLDPALNMRPNCVIFILFGLGLLRNCSSERRGYTVRPISLYMLLFGREKISAGAGINTLAHISRFCRLRLVALTVTSTWMCLSEKMGGRNTVTWGSRERRTGCGRERWSVCMPLDLISPTCPCHSDSQPR